MLSGPEKIAFIVLTFILMSGIGTTLTKESILKLKHKPKLLFAGVFSQIFWMPLISFLCVKFYGLKGEFALALVLIGCTPGGALSNIFTYLSKADIPMSLSLTVVTTLFSFFSFPVLLNLYVNNHFKIQIPYMNILLSLVFMIVPVLIGIVLKQKKEAWAERLEKISSVLGVFIIIYLVLSGLMRNSDKLKLITAAQYLSILTVIISGYGFGFVFSKLFKANLQEAKTISFETGIQNIPLTISIILISFGGFNQDTLLLAPMLFALFSVVIASHVAVFYRSRFLR